MHVVYIDQHFSTLADNTGTRSYEMSRRLLREGHRVTMIAGAYGGAAERLGLTREIEERDIDGIRVIYINEPYENRLSFWQRVRVFGRFARKALAVIRQQQDVDLVFATSTPLTVGIPGLKGAQALGVPFVFEVRDLWPELPIAHHRPLTGHEGRHRRHGLSVRPHYPHPQRRRSGPLQTEVPSPAGRGSG
jgi:hypothetical protein